MYSILFFKKKFSRMLKDFPVVLSGGKGPDYSRLHNHLNNFYQSRILISSNKYIKK